MGPEHDIVFYDGECGLCHRLVQFIVKRDRAGYFRFWPLDSEVFRSRVPASVRESLPDSIVVLTADGRALAQSAGLRQVLAHLPQGWPLVGALLAAVPRPIANRGYDLVARTRHRLFKKPDGACPMVPP